MQTCPPKCLRKKLSLFRGHAMFRVLGGAPVVSRAFLVNQSVFAHFQQRPSLVLTLAIGPEDVVLDAGDPSFTLVPPC